MLKRIVLLSLAAVVAIASAGQTYRVTLYQESDVNGTTLKAGDCKLELEDNRVVISQGKQKVEAPVKVETAESKFPSTSVRYHNGEGKYRVMEIRLGGTSTKLVFN